MRAMTSLTCIYTHRPLDGFSLPWGLHGIVVGAWMNFILVFSDKNIPFAIYQKIFDGTCPLGSLVLLAAGRNWLA